MLSKISSVDITRSLNPFLFAALANCFSFLDFFTAVSSLSRLSRSSFSFGGVTIPSMISSYPLSSAITLNCRANSCQLSFVLLNLYTLILFYIALYFSIDVYLCLISFFRLDPISRRLHVQSVLSIQPDIYKRVEKSQFSIGLISFCADQFNSCALLKSKLACLHVSFTTYEYFYKLSKSASFSRWLLHPVTQKNQ